MTETYTVDSVTEKTSPEKYWEVMLKRDDGKLHCVLLKPEVLRWRAAEYGVDETDTDTLLEIVFHEIMLSLVGTEESGVTLYRASSTALARVEHLARIRTCPIKVDVRGATALDAIRHDHRPDPDAFRAMRESVDITRWHNLYGALPAPSPVRPSGVPLYRKDR